MKPIKEAFRKSLHRIHESLNSARGENGLQPAIDVKGARFELVHVFKTGFHCDVALYARGGEKVVLKAHRSRSLLGIPLRWLGRLLTYREERNMRALEGVRGIPRFLCRHGDTGIVREYIEGTHLKRDMAVSAEFFDALFQMFRELHARQMAYVDLNHMDNVLVGTDGLPHLIDFQFVVRMPTARWFPPSRWILGRMQNADRYYLGKHIERTQPELLPAYEHLTADRPFLSRVMRVLAYPLRVIRRGLRSKVTGRRRR